MSVWGQLVTATVNAAQAFITTFNERNQVPVEEYGWDSYAVRLARYWLYTAYKNNTVYSSINAQAAVLKASQRLYKHIRGIYNPVARQNALLISYIYGGALDLEHLTGGAVPIVTDNTALIDALRKVFVWSRWTELKSLYVGWGASLGDVALKIVDDRERQKVRMEVLHPGKIREVDLDPVGNVQSVVIEYVRDEEVDPRTVQPSRFSPMASQPFPKTYIYTEKIDKEKFQTFKDGQPFAFYHDANGTPLTEWPNEFGFVPLVLAQHSPTGLKWGANAFYNSLRKIDEINDAASLLNDQVRKIVIPLLYATGVNKKSDIDASTEEKDKYTLLIGPKDSTLTPIVGEIDIAGALQNLEAMLMELERDLPELALQRIREQGANMTAPGIRSGFSDAIGRIEEARGNYDGAQVRALQMAVSIGGFNRYEGFSGFNLDSYDRGDMDFFIKNRPVIKDTQSKTERLQTLVSVSGMPPAYQRLALEEMDYPESTIDEVVTEPEVQMIPGQATRPAALPAPNGTNGTGEANGTTPQRMAELMSIWEQNGIDVESIQ